MVTRYKYAEEPPILDSTAPEGLIVPETAEEARLLKSVRRDLGVVWTAFMAILAGDALLFAPDKFVSTHYGTPVVATSFLVAGFVTVFEGIRIAYASHAAKSQKKILA